MIAQAALLLVPLVFVAGCGSSCSVSGKVTWENAPLKNGWITFTPADGKGPISGAPIKDGHYAVGDLQPGPRIVTIIGTKDVPFARSSDDMRKMFEEGKAKGDASGLIDPADIVPPDADGNNANIDLVPGAQTRDFALTKKK